MTSEEITNKSQTPLDTVLLEYKGVIAEKLRSGDVSPDFLYGLTGNNQQSHEDAMTFLEKFVKK